MPANDMEFRGHAAFLGAVGLGYQDEGAALYLLQAYYCLQVTISHGVGVVYWVEPTCSHRGPTCKYCRATVYEL